LSEAVSALHHDGLSIPTSRIYIVFSDVPAHLWGFDGSTFG
jgi:phenylpyruvate tautomerase PptA (4-oxalocrotonate tautomerase family)